MPEINLSGGEAAISIVRRASSFICLAALNTRIG